MRSGDRSERARREILERCDRILANRLEIRLLKRMLELDPFGPRFLERGAEHELELAGVIGLAPGLAAQPLDDLRRCVVVAEPGNEARAVEVRVDLRLEIDLRAFGRETERIVETRLVLHHRAKHHLVVAALGAAEA